MELYLPINPFPAEPRSESVHGSKLAKTFTKKGGIMSLITEQIKKANAALRVEIAEVCEEMDRVDNFSNFRLDLNKRLLELQKQVEQNEKFLNQFEEKKVVNG